MAVTELGLLLFGEPFERLPVQRLSGWVQGRSYDTVVGNGEGHPTAPGLLLHLLVDAPLLLHDLAPSFFYAAPVVGTLEDEGYPPHRFMDEVVHIGCQPVAHARRQPDSPGFQLLLEVVNVAPVVGGWHGIGRLLQVGSQRGVASTPGHPGHEHVVAGSLDLQAKL